VWRKRTRRRRCGLTSNRWFSTYLAQFSTIILMCTGVVLMMQGKPGVWSRKRATSGSLGAEATTGYTLRGVVTAT
jgi:hypothetical protein